MSNLMQNRDEGNLVTTQDTGLVEAAGRILCEGEMAAAEQCAGVEELQRIVDREWFEFTGQARAVLLAILPHLSPESQEMLRKELNGE